MPKDTSIGGQALNWIEQTPLVRTAHYNGWNITRHWAKGTLHKDKDYLYVATKDRHRRITTNDWKDVDTTIYNTELQKLF